MVNNKLEEPFIKLEEKFIETMFEIRDENEIEVNYESLTKILEKINNSHVQSPYDYITQYIFEHDGLDNPDESTIMFEALKTKCLDTGFIKKDDEMDIFLKSIIRHIKLAIIQQNYIEKKTKELLQKTNKIDKKVEESIKEIGNLGLSKSELYTDFIAILGIFSALLFGLFVGFDVFKELIASMSANSKISRSLIMGSLMLLGLSTLIFLLFEGISKLTGRNMKSCCKDTFCKHNIYQRYPVFFISLVILTIIILVSGAAMILNLNGWLYSDSMRNSIILFILVVTALVIFFSWKSVKNPAHPIVSKEEKDNAAK